MDRRARLLGLPLFGLLVAAAAFGCGTSAARGGFFDDAGSGGTYESGGSTGADGGTGGLTVVDSGPSSNGGCSDAAKLVYVVSDASGLYSFTPNTLTFTKIGDLDCKAASDATPNSMAVDRSGTAWVNYSDGTLFKVSTKDATCTSTTFEKYQSFFTRFGMAFSTDSATSTNETLYVGDALADLGLAKIDLTSLKLTTIGDGFSGDLAKASPELTGTGDGRLFGFFTTKPSATLARIDPTTAATSNEQPLDGVRTGNAWAFSFWGGDFWFYTADEGSTPDTTQNSKVTRLKASSDNSLEVVVQDAGFAIVGAGVSTCAPTSPVR